MSSELILRPDGSVYHLGLRPEHSTDLVITVGDPDRVPAVSRHFDEVTIRQRTREFVTHVGRFAGRPITCISTGIGTDNVDIVLNELDALVNVDLHTGRPSAQHRQLTFLRLGTSGTFRPELPVDTLLVSTAAIGLDGLGAGYGFAADDFADALRLRYPKWAAPAYAARADGALLRWIGGMGQDIVRGRTLTCAGFYGPQLRSVRLPHAGPTVRELGEFVGPEADPELQGLHNFEMETAGIYALSTALGHRALSLSALLANRATGTFSETPAATVERMITRTFDLLRAVPLT